MFYIMEYVEGRVFWDSALPEILDNKIRSQMYQEMVEVLAALHSGGYRKSRFERLRQTW